MSAIEAVAAVDDLFRRAVESPDEIDDPALGDWLSDASDSLGSVVSKEDARVLRLAVRLARKLAGYWAERRGSTLPDWRNGVDEALGSRGWEVQLELAMNALERDASPDLFEEVKTRFRTARFEEWMEGVDYQEWVGGREAR